MSELIDFELMNAEEIEAALSGAYGEEIQAEVAAELGIEFADTGANWENAVVSELARLEQQIGRNLTKVEAKRIAEELKPGSEVPNLVERHAEELRSRPDEKESRMALMAERADEAIAEREGASEGWSE